MSPRKTKAPTEDEVKSTPESSAQPSSESPQVPSSSSAPLKPQLPQILKDVDAYRDLKQLIRGCSSSLRHYEVEVIIAMIENHLTIAEAAQMCEVAESTIKKWLKRNEYAGLTDDQKVRRNMFDRWFWGELPYVNEEQWKSLKRQANNYLKTTHTGKECPWAYDFGWNPHINLCEHKILNIPSLRSFFMTLLLNPILGLNDGGIWWLFACVIEVHPNDGHYFAKYQGILGELIVLKFQRI